jgi:hypothetical protein
MKEVFLQSLHIVTLVCKRALPVLFIFTYLQEKKYLEFLDKFSTRIVGKTGFSTITGKAFVANVASAYAGGGLLMNLYRENRISRSNLILSAIFASFPAHIRILMTSTGPVVFTLLTFPVAVFYVVFSLIVAVTKMLIAGLLSHHFANKWSVVKANQLAIHDLPKPLEENRSAITVAFKRTLRYALRMIVFITIVTWVVFYCDNLGLFDKLPFSVAIVGLPEAYNTALFSYLGNVYAGMGVIADFLTKGTLATPDAIKLLVFCMLCARPIIALKESPSYYFGLYGFHNGLLLITFHLSVFMVLGVLTLMGLVLVF